MGERWAAPSFDGAWLCVPRPSPNAGAGAGSGNASREWSEFKRHKRQNKHTQARDASTASYGSSMDDASPSGPAGAAAAAAGASSSGGGGEESRWAGMPQAGTIVEYPLSQQQREELQDGRTHGVGLLVGRNCDRCAGRGRGRHAGCPACAAACAQRPAACMRILRGSRTLVSPAAPAWSPADSWLRRAAPPAVPPQGRRRQAAPGGAGPLRD